MEVKQFLEESLRLKQCTVIVCLDAKGAFDATWWPSNLRQLRELKCSKIYKMYQQVSLAIGKRHYQT